MVMTNDRRQCQRPEPEGNGECTAPRSLSVSLSSTDCERLLSLANTVPLCLLRVTLCERTAVDGTR